MPNVRVLIVGAGGGVPSAGLGGAGGGQVKDNTTHNLTGGAYPVVVGAGGIGNADGEASSFDGESSAGGLKAVGVTGGASGSGNAGGAGTNSGGGGGGQALAGTNAPDDDTGGDGGYGVLSNISGSDDGYSGGGAGQGQVTDGNYGTGGTPANTNGVANHGGGAGGSGPHTGGSGVFIVRYATADFPVGCTGGTITTSGADTIHTFTASGTFTVVAGGAPGNFFAFFSLLLVLPLRDAIAILARPFTRRKQHRYAVEIA